MTYSHEDLNEAKRQIDSTIHKLKETVKTLAATGHSCASFPPRCTSSELVAVVLSMITRLK